MAYVASQKLRSTSGASSSCSRHLPAVRRVQANGSKPDSSKRFLNIRTRAVQTDTVDLALLDSMYTNETFYDLLGVAPNADEKTIKRAYLGMMKECHPDRSMASMDSIDGEATEFCALLNEIYETLSDPARRATYDALFGFSDDSINPFTDPSQELDQVFVDEFTCIGCRNCTNVCPSTFAIEEDWGRARVQRQDADSVPKQQEAIDTCPVNCIHWVSSQQLTLLEAAMARMERISVWAMGMSNSSAANKDVFLEASIAWNKRFQELRRRRAAAGARAGSQPVPGAGGWWNNVVSFEGASQSQSYEAAAKQRARQQAAADAFASGQAPPPVSDKESRSIAALAARAARASRTWKVVQEVAAKARSRGLVLSCTSSASSMDSLDGEECKEECSV